MLFRKHVLDWLFWETSISQLTLFIILKLQVLFTFKIKVPLYRGIENVEAWFRYNRQIFFNWNLIIIESDVTKMKHTLIYIFVLYTLWKKRKTFTTENFFYLLIYLTTFYWLWWSNEKLLLQLLLQSMFKQTIVKVIINNVLTMYSSFLNLRIINYTIFLKTYAKPFCYPFRSNKIYWYMVMVYVSYLKMKNTCEFVIYNTTYKCRTLLEYSPA